MKFAFGAAMLALGKINNRRELDGIKYVITRGFAVVCQTDTNCISVQSVVVVSSFFQR